MSVVRVQESEGESCSETRRPTTQGRQPRCVDVRRRDRPRARALRHPRARQDPRCDRWQAVHRGAHGPGRPHAQAPSQGGATQDDRQRGRRHRPRPYRRTGTGRSRRTSRWSWSEGSRFFGISPARTTRISRRAVLSSAGRGAECDHGGVFERFTERARRGRAARPGGGADAQAQLHRH